jgi:carbon monoxide dehydrogenase subunit G
MGRFFVTETIEAPTDAVWAILRDPARAPEWMKTVALVEKSSEGEIAKGATFHASSSKRGRHGRTVTVAEWEEGRRVALASKTGGVSSVYDYVCEPAEDGKTKVTLKATCDGKGFLWTIMQPMLIFMIKSTDGGQLKRLKKLVETPPAPANDDADAKVPEQVDAA